MNKITNCLFHYPRRWTFQTRHTRFIYPFHTSFSDHTQTRNLNIKLSTKSDPPPDTIRIGCASGFWGDTGTAVGQLVKHGRVDFLVLDYLSEVTMSLLVAAKLKNKDLGWCPDFAKTVGPLLPDIKAKGIKVITNAGGINSIACMETMLSISKKMGLDFKISVILGDDLFQEKDKLTIENVPVDNVTSMNAYLGAAPITRALDMGADIVICGRCTDSALAIAPCVHKFKWAWNEWDHLAAASLAGHLIECGAQSTGGICTEWDSVSGWENNGFPIAICGRKGQVVITKPDNTGGVVNRCTVSEQLLYEIHDPSAYILPDCVCDFSNVKVTERPDGSVLCTRAKGNILTPYYKVGGTYQDGWKCTAVCPIIGPRAVQKGEKTAKAILDRCRHIFSEMKLPDFTRVHLQVLGSEQAYGQQARKANLETRDAVLWMSVAHKEKSALEVFSQEIASAGTGMAPGLTAVIGGRPKPTPLIRFFSYLHDRKEIDNKVIIRNQDGYEENFIAGMDVRNALFIEEEATRKKNSLLRKLQGSPKEKVTREEPLKRTYKEYSYKVSDLAWTRSGDKGDICNIGVIAKEPSNYPLLVETLTAKKVTKYFEHKFTSDKVPTCKRYEVPGVFGLNFVLEDSLGGGGIGSLTPDPQGKGYGQMLLDLEINSKNDEIDEDD